MIQAKHAYLIIANRNFDQLRLLVSLLDDSRNDIFILIDKKSPELSSAIQTQYSPVTMVDRLPIYWGDYSQVEAELRLFSIASQTADYAYYHLLSGLDLPLVSQNTIHDFFDNQPNKIFVTYSAMSNQTDLQLRVQPHCFRKHYRIGESIPDKILRQFRKVENRVLKRRLHADSKTIEFGSNWVSLPDFFVKQMTTPSNLQKIRNVFEKGYLVDELLIPYEVEQLKARKSVYYAEPVHDLPEELQGNLRYIDWWDGTPYIWRANDFGALKAARQKGHFFARKFDQTVDSEIIKLVVEKLVKDVAVPLNTSPQEK